MTFDMIAGKRRDSFEYEEEVIFQVTSKDKRRFPTLSFIWEFYYDDPWLSASQARDLASELADLLTLNEVKANPRLSASVIRLAQFFKEVHLANLSIQCQSD